MALLQSAAPVCERVAAQLERKNLAGGTLVLKLKTADFQLLARNCQLLHPTNRASVLLEPVTPMIEREAEGRSYRLIGIGIGIGIGVDRLSPASDADPPDLFDDLDPKPN